MYKLINFLLLIIFVAGCAKRSDQILMGTRTQNNELCLTDRLSSLKNKNTVIEATQHDLAVPVGYKLKGYSESGGTSGESMLFVYGGGLSVFQVGNFYKKELELAGWVYSDMSTKKEGLLIASKPLKKCAISIRPIKQNSSTIHVFIWNKHDSDHQNLVDLNRINGAS